MKRLFLAISTCLMALGLQATEVKSPNGQIVLNFTIEDGRPTYSLSYKGREVVRPSHLGLELAPASLTRHGSPFGAKRVISVTTTTSMWLR